MMEKPKFQGTDYAELATHWGIETDECVLIEKYIKESLYTAYDELYAGGTVLDSAVKGAMLEFLDEFIKKHDRVHYGNYIFIGLRMIAQEDDETFVSYFCDLLPRMWC